MLHRWKKLIALDKGVLTSMLIKDFKDAAVTALWKMTGIQVLALAVSFDIPVLDDPETIHHLA